MDTMRRRLAVAFSLFFLVPGTALAQGLSGSLSGSVKDEQGGHLAGATVIVASPAQIGGRPAHHREREGSVAVPRTGPWCVRPDRRDGAGLCGVSGRRHQHWRRRGARARGGPEAGQRCPVRDCHRGFEHRVAFERARDAVRARPSHDDPHAAVQHVRRDPKCARHVTDIPVQRRREHRVFVWIGRERECLPHRRHELHVPVCGCRRGPSRVSTSSRKSTSSQSVPLLNSGTSRAL